MDYTILPHQIAVFNRVVLLRALKDVGLVLEMDEATLSRLGGYCYMCNDASSIHKPMVRPSQGVVVAGEVVGVGEESVASQPLIVPPRHRPFENNLRLHILYASYTFASFMSICKRYAAAVACKTKEQVPSGTASSPLHLSFPPRWVREETHTEVVTVVHEEAEVRTITLPEHAALPPSTKTTSFFPSTNTSTNTSETASTWETAFSCLKNNFYDSILRLLISTYGDSSPFESSTRLSLGPLPLCRSPLAETQYSADTNTTAAAAAAAGSDNNSCALFTKIFSLSSSSLKKEDGNTANDKSKSNEDNRNKKEGDTNSFYSNTDDDADVDNDENELLLLWVEEAYKYNLSTLLSSHRLCVGGSRANAGRGLDFFGDNVDARDNDIEKVKVGGEDGEEGNSARVEGGGLEAGLSARDTKKQFLQHAILREGLAELLFDLCRTAHPHHRDNNDDDEASSINVAADGTKEKREGADENAAFISTSFSSESRRRSADEEQSDLLLVSKECCGFDDDAVNSTAATATTTKKKGPIAAREVDISPLTTNNNNKADEDNAKERSNNEWGSSTLAVAAVELSEVAAAPFGEKRWYSSPLLVSIMQRIGLVEKRRTKKTTPNKKVGGNGAGNKSEPSEEDHRTAATGTCCGIDDGVAREAVITTTTTATCTSTTAEQVSISSSSSSSSSSWPFTELSIRQMCYSVLPDIVTYCCSCCVRRGGGACGSGSGDCAGRSGKNESYAVRKGAADDDEAGHSSHGGGDGSARTLSCGCDSSSSERGYSLLTKALLRYEQERQDRRLLLRAQRRRRRRSAKEISGGSSDQSSAEAAEEPAISGGDSPVMSSSRNKTVGTTTVATLVVSDQGDKNDRAEFGKGVDFVGDSSKKKKSGKKRIREEEQEEDEVKSNKAGVEYDSEDEPLTGLIHRKVKPTAATRSQKADPPTLSTPSPPSSSAYTVEKSVDTRQNDKNVLKPPTPAKEVEVIDLLSSSSDSSSASSSSDESENKVKLRKGVRKRGSKTRQTGDNNAANEDPGTESERSSSDLFATADDVPRIMKTNPKSLPWGIIVAHRKPLVVVDTARALTTTAASSPPQPLPEPSISLFELANHYTLRELQSYFTAASEGLLLRQRDDQEDNPAEKSEGVEDNTNNNTNKNTAEGEDVDMVSTTNIKSKARPSCKGGRGGRGKKVTSRSTCSKKEDGPYASVSIATCYSLPFLQHLSLEEIVALPKAKGGSLPGQKQHMANLVFVLNEKKHAALCSQ